MKHLSFNIVLFLTISNISYAQKVDSIFFHLYTDSLKKGTYNYINVDGKNSEGRWLPLTTQEVIFSCSAGKFEGNNLILEKNFSEDSVVVTAGLKSNSLVKKTVTIYVKKLEDSEKLKTKEEIMREVGKPRKGKSLYEPLIQQ